MVSTKAKTTHRNYQTDSKPDMPSNWTDPDTYLRIRNSRNQRKKTNKNIIRRGGDADAGVRGNGPRQLRTRQPFITK